MEMGYLFTSAVYSQHISTSNYHLFHTLLISASKMFKILGNSLKNLVNQNQNYSFIMKYTIYLKGHRNLGKYFDD